MAERVPEIISVHYVFQTSNPPNLIVTAVGQVPTLGWKNATLSPRVYVVPPADGVWEFDMYAEPPTGIVAQVISAVVAGHVWERFDQPGIVGVRVWGAKNYKEIRFAERSSGCT